MMIELFIFDDLEEAFRNGIVPAVALATHGCRTLPMLGLKTNGRT